VISHGITGCGRAWIYQEIRAGRFPKPLRLGPKTSGWRSTDIHAWMATRGVGVHSAPYVPARGRRGQTEARGKAPSAA